MKSQKDLYFDLVAEHAVHGRVGRARGSARAAETGAAVVSRTTFAPGHSRRSERSCLTAASPSAATEGWTAEAQAAAPPEAAASWFCLEPGTRLERALARGSEAMVRFRVTVSKCASLSPSSMLANSW